MNDTLQNQVHNLRSQMNLQREGGRDLDAPRPITLQTDFTRYAEGSVLVSTGNTRIICNASIEDKVPPFLRGAGKGWVTAEYAMLPRATSTRTNREVTQGKPSGRSSEIQRLIGRSLRSVMDLTVLGERTVWLDCDVIQADGGTRTAAITGAFVALVLALRELGKTHKFKKPPLKRYVSAVSVGLLEGQGLLDLDYAEDSTATVDLNVVMSDALEVIEIQGTAEEAPFTRQQLDAMLDLAEKGIVQRIEAQKAVLGNKLF